MDTRYELSQESLSLMAGVAQHVFMPFLLASETYLPISSSWRFDIFCQWGKWMYFLLCFLLYKAGMGQCITGATVTYKLACLMAFLKGRDPCLQFFTSGLLLGTCAILPWSELFFCSYSSICFLQSDSQPLWLDMHSFISKGLGGKG